MSKTSFPWLALKAICDGVSILDIPKLELKSEAEAHQFLVTYGYDLYDPSHRDQVWEFYDEAVRFVETSLDFSVADQLKDRTKILDFKNLLLIASGHQYFPQSKFQLQVCALLRVMHVLSHLKNDLRLKYLSKIRKQTIGRFEAHVQKQKGSESESLFLGFETDKISLIRFDKKSGKDKNSVLMKLLQKPTSVAQEIYDHIGVRFVTPTRIHAILVVKYLLDHHLISVANIMSARCRNTLFSLDDLRGEIEMLDLSDKNALLAAEKRLRYPAGSFGADNPFSSPDYHSLQFTCRPLIRIPVVRKGVRAEMSFFFPMEIQILDQESFATAQAGDAKHSNYKRKQLTAVKSRIFGGQT